MQAEQKQTEQGMPDGGRPLRIRDYFVYYLGYTVLFCVTAAAVFVWLYLKKRRFVWKTDGVNQHYYGLLYFSRWGKEVLRQFRETGVWKLPTFSLRMGYGEDIYTTLAYYVIGDPFTLPAVFVPERFLLLYHDLALLARFWLAGITFSAYCFCMKARASRPGVMAGAFIYIFNGFTMSGMRHHYFLNPFVFFPLLLIGCERIFRKKRPGLFIFMVFVTAVSNFYFFYMMVLMTVLYAVWRSVRIHGLRGFGHVIVDGIAFVWYGILGTLLSAFLFLPIILRFLQDPRAADNKTIPYFWTASFYRNFLDSFLSNGTAALSESWTYMGFGAVALLCVLFIFIQRRKHFDLKAAFIVLTAMLLTPVAGYVLNGFSYPVNRWMWTYALLIGYMTATAVPEMAQAGIRKLLAVLVAFALCIAVCVGWSYTFSRASSQAVVIALFGFSAVLLGRIAWLEIAAAGSRSQQQDAGAQDVSVRLKQNRVSVRAQAVLLACVILSISSAGYYDYSPRRSAKVYEYLSRAQIETQTAKDAAAASQLIDGKLLKEESSGTEGGKTGASGEGRTPFYRYTSYNPENNTSILYGVSNTQYYWSLSNKETARFFNETGQLNRMIDMYDTLDDRTFLNEIAGIRYFLGNDEDGLPFGYEKKEGLSYSNADLWPENEGLERFSCEIYENRYALPLGFTSDKWISREEYDALDIPQRQEALMQGILLEEDPGEDYVRVQAQDGSLQFSGQTIPVRVEAEQKKIKADGLSFEVKEAGAVLTVSFEGLPNCETSLYVRGLRYEPPAGRKGSTKFMLPVTGYAGTQSVATKQIGLTTEMDPWTTGREDYQVNMRYRAEALDRFEISLIAAGTFSFDSIEVVCQPMTAYPAQAEELRSAVLTDLDIHEMGDSGATERITGKIDLEEPRILCLQIPRTPGWTALVDGAPAKILQADTMFSALLLPAGSHEIELRYQTPGLRLGAAISAGTLLLLLLFALIYTVVAAILRAGARRRAKIPTGTFSPAPETAGETASKPENTGGAVSKPTAAGGAAETPETAGESAGRPAAAGGAAETGDHG
ncbi:MAG: YfhO family protein [Eubacteriales bacterium]|nr:YfhO family protein [Eubacteriales bacterium]